MPPEATNPLLEPFTPNVPGLNTTFVVDAPAHLTTRVRLSLLTFDAKAAQELVPAILSVAVTLLTVAEPPVDGVQSPMVIGLMVAFSLAVPAGKSGGLKVTVAPRLAQLTVPLATAANAVSVVARLTNSPMDKLAATTEAAHFLCARTRIAPFFGRLCTDRQAGGGYSTVPFDTSTERAWTRALKHLSTRRCFSEAKAVLGRQPTA